MVAMKIINNIKRRSFPFSREKEGEEGGSL